MNAFTAQVDANRRAAEIQYATNEVVSKGTLSKDGARFESCMTAKCFEIQAAQWPRATSFVSCCQWNRGRGGCLEAQSNVLGVLLPTESWQWRSFVNRRPFESLQDGAKTPDGRKLRDVMARCEVLTTERKKSEFKARDVELDMARLVKGSPEQHRGLGDTENAAAALAAVLAYTVS